MLSKIKSMLLSFVKSEITSNLGLLDTLVTPELVSLLTTKGKLDASLAGPLAADVVAVLKTGIVNLLGKI